MKKKREMTPPPPRELRSRGAVGKQTQRAKKTGNSKGKSRARKQLQQTEQPKETSVVVVSAAGSCDRGANNDDDDSSKGTSNGTYLHVCTPITYGTDKCCAIFIEIMLSGEQDGEVEDDNGTI